jgi:hypothetical protein
MNGHFTARLIFFLTLTAWGCAAKPSKEIQPGTTFWKGISGGFSFEWNASDLKVKSIAEKN